MPSVETVLARFAQRRNAPAAYLIALILTAVAIGARIALAPVLPGFVFVTLYPAVLISAAIGGLWAGVMSATIGGVAAWYLFAPSVPAIANPTPTPWAGIVAFAATSILISVIMRFLRATIRQLEAQRTRTHHLLQEAESERTVAQTAQATAETALAEMNHRVKNSLQIAASLLRLQAGTTGDTTRSALQQAASRVDTVARVHRHLTGLQALEAVDFGQYLRGFCDEIASVLQGPTVLSFKVECPNFKVSTRQAVALGLIINELLTNVTKYAYPGEARGTATIKCERTHEGATQLRVVDRGVGLPAGFDPSKSSGLGMRIVAALCQQIGAQLEIDRSGRNGASFLITVPPGSGVHS
jgi:two-component sensor histidine kinase